MTLKNRFKIILSTRKKRNGAFGVLTVVLVMAIFGTLVACNVTQTLDEPGNPPPDMAALRGEYFDFAIKYRLDYIPFFEEGKAPTDSTKYLFWAFAVNLDNWGEDKGIMTRAYVDTAIHDHFEVGEIAHASMWKGWNFDGEKYVAVPQSIREEPLYALREYLADVIGGQTVYTITLAQCVSTTCPPFGEEMAKYRAEIVSGDLSNLKVTRTETFRFYLNEETGEPVFLSHALSPAQAYFDYFVYHSRQVNPLFAVPNDDEDALDANLMVFAFQNLEVADFTKGSSREEIDAILNKYFGRTVGKYITSYSVGLVNGNVTPSGWSFHGCNRLVLTRLSAEDNGSFTGVFDVYYIPEGEENLAAINEALRGGDTDRYQSYFSQSVIINWHEIEDETEPQGFYIRYNSILPGKAQDWSAGRSENAAFFFVGGNFLGSYEKGEWVSLTDPKVQDCAPARYRRFLIKDLLSRGYAVYSREKKLGPAGEVVLYAGGGPSGFPDGDKTALFLPYAKEKNNGFCVLPLPVELSGGELDTLAAPTYGFSLYMGNDMTIEGEIKAPALATNALIIPPDGIVWADTVSSADAVALQKVLTENNVQYDDPAVTAATGDFDSDGKKETVIFANVRIGSDGYLDVSSENKTLFSVVLMRDNGSYHTVYSRFMPYTSDVTAHFLTSPIGVFDLNGDGVHDICVKSIGWEGGSNFVLAKNARGEWEQVLLAMWGI